MTDNDLVSKAAVLAEIDFHLNDSLTDSCNPLAILEHIKTRIRALPPADEVERLREAQRIVDEQAKEEGLWFIPDSVIEAYFQQELRRLHEAIEGKSSEECAYAAITSIGED